MNVESYCVWLSVTLIYTEKFMVVSEHEWIFSFELSALGPFCGGNLTVVNSCDTKFSMKVVSAYFLEV